VAAPKRKVFDLEVGGFSGDDLSYRGDLESDAAPETEVFIPIDTQIYSRPLPSEPPFYKDPAVYAAVGISSFLIGGLLYVYRKKASVQNIEDRSPSPVRQPPIEAVEEAILEDKPIRISFPNALKTGLELQSQLETIFEAPLSLYRESGWAESRILLDFTDPFSVDRSPARPDVPLSWIAPKETRQNSVIVNVPFDPDLGNPKDSAVRLVEYLQKNNCLRMDSDSVIDVNLGRFNTVPYVMVYGAPEKIQMTNARVKDVRRVPISARPLRYVLTLGAPPNREDVVSRGGSAELNFRLSDVGITPYYKDFLARILSGEMNGWNKEGKCYANDAGAPLWCEFERAAILQTALNRIESLQAKGRISRRGLAEWTLDNLLELLRMTEWNNSKKFKELFSLGSESWIYRSNREFIDLAMFFPDFIPQSLHFVHYLGFSKPEKGTPTPCLPVWIAGQKEGGQVKDYPKQIGYALFSEPDNGIRASNNYCR